VDPVPFSMRLCMVYMKCLLLETLLVVVNMYGDFLYSVERLTTNLDLWFMLSNSLLGWEG